MLVQSLENIRASEADAIDVYQCQRLPAGNGAPWDQPTSNLSREHSIPLSQHWLPETEPSFMPASVSATWDDQNLYIYARLEDRDIFNPVRGFNKLASQQGDIFEILLKLKQTDPYFEIHITPYNQVMQLRFPSAESIKTFRATGGDIESLIASYAVPTPILASRTQFFSKEGYWTVSVKIPASSFGLPSFQRGNSLRFSFCRYDRTQGQSAPVLSSTSNYPVCDFHRQENWKTMVLIGD